MSAGYLSWLAPVFEEAQVPFNDATAPYLDIAVRNLVQGKDLSEEEVFRLVREKWLKHGPSGRQLLAAFLRDECFSRRDSPLRPREGDAYYTNAYVPKNQPPVPR